MDLSYGAKVAQHPNNTLTDQQLNNLLFKKGGFNSPNSFFFLFLVSVHTINY
jgi:hypothetical protein